MENPVCFSSSEKYTKNSIFIRVGPSGTPQTILGKERQTIYFEQTKNNTVLVLKCVKEIYKMNKCNHRFKDSRKTLEKYKG